MNEKQIVTDEFGTWEVQHDVGSISRCIIEPTEKYEEVYGEVSTQ